jgi:hypothetical protein
MTELREGILRNQIQTLEGQANKLEEMVYFQIAGLPEDQEEMDGRILRNLIEMDRLQAEIDQLTDKLKAEGFWEPASYADGKYIYTRPKAKPQPKKEPRKPRKVYSSETTEQRKKREAAEERKRKKALRESEKAAKAAEKQRLKEEREAEREALRKTPRPPRPPKPKTEPKQRKPAESKEIVALKKRWHNQRSRMKAFAETYEPKRKELEERIQYFEAKLVELAEVDWKDRGHQKRHTARVNMQKVQKQLDELPVTYETRRKKFEEQIAKLDQEITEQYLKEAS